MKLLDEGQAIVFLDTETTGLDVNVHQVWEMAWLRMAPPGVLSPVHQFIARHDLTYADPTALRIGRHQQRCTGCWKDSTPQEDSLKMALKGATLCAANPAFDAAFLQKRWGRRFWHYRLLDIEAYAMPALGSNVPVSLNDIVRLLPERYGVTFTTPADHTAAADATTVAEAYIALRSIYTQIR